MDAHRDALGAQRGDGARARARHGVRDADLDKAHAGVEKRLHGVALAGHRAVDGLEVEVRHPAARRTRGGALGEPLRARPPLPHLERLRDHRAVGGGEHAPGLGMGLRQAVRAGGELDRAEQGSRSARVNGAGVDDADAADAPSAATAGAQRARRGEDIAPRRAGRTAADASRDLRWASSPCGATTPRTTGHATARIEPRRLRRRDAVREGGKVHRATPRRRRVGARWAFYLMNPSQVRTG